MISSLNGDPDKEQGIRISWWRTEKRAAREPEQDQSICCENRTGEGTQGRKKLATVALRWLRVITAGITRGLASDKE